MELHIASLLFTVCCCIWQHCQDIYLVPCTAFLAVVLTLSRARTPSLSPSPSPEIMLLTIKLLPCSTTFNRMELRAFCKALGAEAAAPKVASLTKLRSDCCPPHHVYLHTPTKISRADNFSSKRKGSECTHLLLFSQPQPMQARAVEVPSDGGLVLPSVQGTPATGHHTTAWPLPRCAQRAFNVHSISRPVQFGDDKLAF